jgi:hypothetical protein
MSGMTGTQRPSGGGGQQRPIRPVPLSRPGGHPIVSGKSSTPEKSSAPEKASAPVFGIPLQRSFTFGGQDVPDYSELQG